MPSTNCQRHAGARKGQGTLTKIKNKNRIKPAQLPARKKRDFKPSVWLFPLRATGSFYSALPHGGTEVFIRCSRLKAPDKRYLNDSTSEQWSAESARSWTNSPRARQALLWGCQQLLKVVGCRVQYSWRLLCTEPCEQTLTADQNRSCSWAGQKVAFTPSNAVTLMRFRNKHTQNLEKNKKSQAITFQKETKQFLIPPLARGSHQCCGDRRDKALHSFLLSPNAKFHT